jgi:hypothetical protein
LSFTDPQWLSLWLAAPVALWWLRSPRRPAIRVSSLSLFAGLPAAPRDTAPGRARMIQGVLAALFCGLVATAAAGPTAENARVAPPMHVLIDASPSMSAVLGSGPTTRRQAAESFAAGLATDLGSAVVTEHVFGEAELVAQAWRKARAGESVCILTDHAPAGLPEQALVFGLDRPGWPNLGLVGAGFSPLQGEHAAQASGIVRLRITGEVPADLQAELLFVSEARRELLGIFSRDTGPRGAESEVTSDSPAPLDLRKSVRFPLAWLDEPGASLAITRPSGASDSFALDDAIGLRREGAPPRAGALHSLPAPLARGLAALNLAPTQLDPDSPPSPAALDVILLGTSSAEAVPPALRRVPRFVWTSLEAEGAASAATGPLQSVAPHGDRLSGFTYTDVTGLSIEAPLSPPPPGLLALAVDAEGRPVFGVHPGPPRLFWLGVPPQHPGARGLTGDRAFPVLVAEALAWLAPGPEPGTPRTTGLLDAAETLQAGPPAPGLSPPSTEQVREAVQAASRRGERDLSPFALGLAALCWLGLGALRVYSRG